ncbi:ribosome biogenesis GTPase Der [Candidatus Paracaedibacter symbiosus]|uniref:ribosome biogenesis GTPase Der n=1 Tax=Candidatus Paracaedibacter symbiosus TaxID=244582 RepID=UPI000509684F|nr:ribosome biogenesis GTPase Der [Candidatus Paracaedibacter symbiosus]
MKKIAIIGRPNVGKSTLFNRLVGRRIALVHNQPGMTRDRREEQATLYGLTFLLTDTAGLADPDDSSLTKAMYQQTMMAVEDATVVLFVIDAREGCTPYDRELANVLRKAGKPILVIANKSEGGHEQFGIAEGIGLSLGEVIPFSSEHGIGMGDLYQALCPYFADEIAEEETDDSFEEEPAKEESERPKKPIQLAIVGRPNVGKSTLINKLIGENRLLTADMPGVTRDAISIDWTYKDTQIKLIDTAGIRRRSKVTASPEKLAILDTDRSIQFAEVAVLMIDATCPFEKQDLTIAQNLTSEGRAVVVALNKWDLVDDKTALLKELQETIETHLSQIKGVSLIPISAEKGKNLDRLMDAVLDIYRLWNKRISTGQLNKWLEYVLTAHPTPAVNGRRIKIKYMTQIKTRPPTFALFASQADELPTSYTRYLVNNLRKDFDLPGVPIRIQIRGSANPYDPKKK